MLNENIKISRKSKGLSQDELAIKLNVVRQTVLACMAARLGLKCIVVQECYDSRRVGQPEILEKQRACEAMGAEVVQLTVRPELFYETLMLLEDTGFYNASLYTPSATFGRAPPARPRR